MDQEMQTPQKIDFLTGKNIYADDSSDGEKAEP